MDDYSDRPLGQLGGTTIGKALTEFRIDVVFAVCAGALLVGAAVTEGIAMLYWAIGAGGLAWTTWWGREQAYERTLFYSDRAEMHSRQGPPRVILRNSIASVRFAQKQNDTAPYVEFVLEDKRVIPIFGSNCTSGVANMPNYGRQRSAIELARRIEIWRQTAHYS